MITHPDLFKKCKLDASPAVGVTFEPWGKSAPMGQVERVSNPRPKSSARTGRTPGSIRLAFGRFVTT